MNALSNANKRENMTTTKDDLQIRFEFCIYIKLKQVVFPKGVMGPHK